MDRRRFLKSSGILLATFSAGGLVTACGDDTPRALREGGQEVPNWNLINASFEVLSGEQRRFLFGLTTTDNEPVARPELEVYTRQIGGEVTGGPYPVEFFSEGPAGLGIYLTRLDLTEGGPTEVLAVEGDDFGAAAVNVVDPEDAQVPVPGSEAIETATATESDDLGLEEVCTRDPDCTMHDISLDEALDTGRPIVLMFATPAYCRTAVCGPVVDTLEELHTAEDFGDVVFIHSEIFTDAGQTIAPPVADWGLPSEPWMFTINRDGRITDRIDGPMVAPELRRMIGQIA